MEVKVLWVKVWELLMGQSPGGVSVRMGLPRMYVLMWAGLVFRH